MKKCKRRPFYQLAAIVLLFPLAACTMAGKPSVGLDVRDGSLSLPNKLLVLPVTVSISEISAGGVVQEDPIWSKEGESAMTLAVKEYFAKRGATSLQSMPEMSDEKVLEISNRYIELYEKFIGSPLERENSTSIDARIHDNILTWLKFENIIKG